MTAIDTRNLKRDSLFLLAEIRLDGATSAVQAKVRNLSNSGMMIDGGLIAERGQRLVVSLRQVGEVAGKVAWKQNGKIGIAFDDEIDAAAARTKLYSGESEAPRYSRPAVAPRGDQWSVRKL